MMLEHIARVGEHNCNMVCATHNEAGATHAASKVTTISTNQVVRLPSKKNGD